MSDASRTEQQGGGAAFVSRERYSACEDRSHCGRDESARHCERAVVRVPRAPARRDDDMHPAPSLVASVVLIGVIVLTIVGALGHGDAVPQPVATTGLPPLGDK